MTFSMLAVTLPISVPLTKEDVDRLFPANDMTENVKNLLAEATSGRWKKSRSFFYIDKNCLKIKNR